MNKDPSHFPENLAFLRKSKNITQAELANKIGVDQSTIGRWEDGNREPTVGYVAKISNYFLISIPDLLNLNLATTDISTLSKIDFLFYKSRNLLNNSELAMIESTMQRAIKRHESTK